jgi:hypothetical protein
MRHVGQASGRSSVTSNHSERGAMGDAATSNMTSRSEEAMHEASVVPGGTTGQDAVAPPGESASAPAPYPTYHGRTVSWVAVGIIVVGFIVGGLALIFGHGGPIWWLFWVGVGLSALGLLVSVATNMFEDWY